MRSTLKGVMVCNIDRAGGPTWAESRQEEATVARVIVVVVACSAGLAAGWVSGRRLWVTGR